MAVACQKEDRLQVPVSAIAASWIPADKDSIRYKPEFTRGVTFVRQGTLQRNWNNVGGAAETAIITQSIYSLDGNFSLNLKLETDYPETLPGGGLARKEQLTITNLLGQDYFLSFYRDTVTTNLFIVDTLQVNNQTYLGVLTDNQTFYMNQQYFVFRYLDNNIWHNLIR